MAVEIVELIPWDKLALTRKNRKSLESQNQRGIVDFNCFYIVLIAHIALGFSSKQIDLINKAKTICECLIASEGIDLKFEEAFCLFLLRQGDEATAVERLRQLELNLNPTSKNSLQTKEIGEVSNANKSLETWLKDAVLSLFPDTRDCSPSLANFFNGEKRWNRQNKRAPQAMSNMRHRPLAPALAFDQKDEEPVSRADSSRHLGLAAKQLAPFNLQSPLIEVKSNAGTGSTPSIQLKRSLGAWRSEEWKFWLGPY
ncbi:Plastid division protein CDP1 [Abeliophyllum distichum]|uniref:Plastid division protein CDP1 n=1 Tax=Abeliophyllum distichum TaxID=126358 RepID=A0ABD1PDW6_9LAMI